MEEPQTLAYVECTRLSLVGFRTRFVIPHVTQENDYFKEMKTKRPGMEARHTQLIQRGKTQIFKTDITRVHSM